MDVSAAEALPQETSVLNVDLGRRSAAAASTETAARRGSPRAAREDFLLEIERAVARTAKTGGCVAVLTLNVDRFASLAQALRETAAELLPALARRLRADLRRGDTLAVLDGGDLGLVIHGVRDEREAEIVAERLHAAIRAPLTIAAHELCVTASIGVALWPADGRRAAEVAVSASRALRAAKDAGRNRTCFASQDVNQRLQRRRIVRDELNAALANRRFAVCFQPRFDLSTSTIHSIAASVYWRHPTKGALELRRFVAAAEEEGLLGAIEQQALDAVLDQIANWRLEHRQLPLVTMKISSCQFLADGFVERLDEMLELRDLKSSVLELAISESALVRQPGRAIDNITRLDALGVRVAISDFGSGFSPLSYLTYLPINSINLTGAVVASLGDERHAAVARSIVSLAHELDITVSAEGITRSEQLAQLAELRCEIVQGDLLQRILSADALTAVLARAASSPSKRAAAAS